MANQGLMNERAKEYSRREALARTGLIAGAAAVVGHPRPAAAESSGRAPDEFVFCFNTGTIRGQKLGLAKEVEVAAKAGYQALEPWVESIQQYAAGGGALADLRKRLSDLGLTVEGAIGFANWIVDDAARRAQALEQVKREMDLLAQLGVKRLAAPPAGATDQPGLDLGQAGERYRALLELGDQMGVVPQLELWGFSKNLRLLGEVAYVAIETGHPKACVLPDIFHIYKGGSDFRGLKHFGPDTIQMFHLNDYPSEPPRERANDSHRVLPGDGVAPIVQVLRDLRAAGGRKVLSLELFNRKFWEQDPVEVARTGLAKMQALVQKAIS
jgi:sugar phosphate isomerase/epimerase